MPGAAQNGLEPQRFAALWAGCDTGNASEAEALSKFRALRRMAMAENLRIIDAMGRADVMQALDVQLEPVREESPELKAAFLEVAKIADLAQRRQEVIDELQEQLAAGRGAGISARPMPPPRVSDGGMVGGMVNGGLVAAVSIVAVLLMLAAWFQAFQ
jgi:hypothetical protein